MFFFCLAAGFAQDFIPNLGTWQCTALDLVTLPVRPALLRPLPHKLLLHHSLLDDTVGEITLTNGITCILKFAQFPAPVSDSASDAEPSTACLLWGDTKTALDAAGFHPSAVPKASAPPRDMYTIRPSAIAGTGMFAARDIACGEIILVERPFYPEELATWPWDTLKPMMLDALYAFVVERLLERQRTDLFALFSSDESVYQLMSQNAITVVESLPGRYTGFHSLIWNADSLSISVNALARIRKGAELLHTYGNQFQHLQPRAYDFHCKCPVCSLPDASSAADDGIRRMLEANVCQIDEMFAESADRDRESAYDPAVDACRPHHCALWVRRAMHYLRLVAAYAALADAEETRFWAARIVALGHPQLAVDIAWVETLVADLETAKEWGQKKRLHEQTQKVVS
ncbi:hypothetical protein GGX14DRAFT_634679 [Mycena pura]|uniref:SET domain-containing protein n=1 Tax=Mycena pura TaxID=153505 RepID=A0AAD6Y8Z9_9AGAR|nr:hypothetical protein GGX14DRAFT_634679 [Mycena pura]